ncbi:hypothetical protein LUZ60_007347 [Juncus effusus]|nr:hypothetical protein LUZ60_007347 [Juncus effusus]
MKSEDLDFVLVPLGLVALVMYHLWLLFQIRILPGQTVIGINARNRVTWVETIMEEPGKTGVLAVQTIRNNIMASTMLASTAIMLASVIAVLMTSSNSSNSSSNNPHPIRGENIIFGNKSDAVLSIKFFAILICFLLAFLLNVQSVRYYSHASTLITVPAMRSHRKLRYCDYVARTLNKGSYFWSLGLHAFYISIPLFIWIFGPIPMFLCSFVLVGLLYFLDIYSAHGAADDEEIREKKKEKVDGSSGHKSDIELSLASDPGQCSFAGSGRRSARLVPSIPTEIN